jgi:hypothetical protein
MIMFLRNKYNTIFESHLESDYVPTSIPAEHTEVSPDLPMSVLCTKESGASTNHTFLGCEIGQDI